MEALFLDREDLGDDSGFPCSYDHDQDPGGPKGSFVVVVLLKKIRFEFRADVMAGDLRILERLDPGEGMDDPDP